MNLPQDDPELASRLSGVGCLCKWEPFSTSILRHNPDCSIHGPQSHDPVDAALDLDYARFRLLEASRGLQEAISQTVAAIIVAQIDIDRWIKELEDLK
jgi:hypothetical protein